jgi:hypothetical protein
MAAATATSKVSPVVIGSGRMKSTTYIATKVTGPDKNNQYSSEIVQYDNAKGEGAKTIGTRDSSGNITWNSNASGRTKLNESKFKKASNNQIESVQKDLAKTAQETAGVTQASGKKNQDNTDGNTNNTQAKATPAPRDASGSWSGSDTVTSSSPARNSYSQGLCYPIAMRQNLQDCIQIKVIKFMPRAMGGASLGDRPKGATIGSVFLPMPSAIQDGNKTEWGSGTMTPVQIAAAGATKDFLTGNASAAAQGIQQTVDEVGREGDNVTEAMASMFTEQLTGAENILARTTGAVMNPNMELLFKGPSLRSFSFAWKMSPRDEKESLEIGKIIRMFKQSMAPQKTTEDLFLKAPSIYDIEFRSKGGRNRFLPKIKSCALVDCAVNYTPDGSYMSYTNSSMVALEMSLSFQETEPIYNNDMSGSDSSIGY